MRLCEKSGDYSFIYSNSPRDNTEGRRWRPVAGKQLPPLMTVHVFGESQPGHRDPDSIFFLDNIATFNVEESEDERVGMGFLNQWYARDSSWRRKHEKLSESIFLILEELGFKGSPYYLAARSGCFYPAWGLDCDIKKTELLLSTTLRWSCGAPGLAKTTDGGRINYTPGIFVGCVPKGPGMSIMVE